MGLREILERHRDCKQFRHILYRLHVRGFRSYQYTDRKLSEAYSILERLKGKISETKMKVMEGAMNYIEDEFEYAWLSGAFG